MSYGVIYLITNIINSKKYVGQTTRLLEVRIAEHRRGNQYIDKAIKKYGCENFSVEVLEECENRKQLDEREIFWIAELNCKYPDGYNQTIGGAGDNICTQEKRAKLSLAASGENNYFFGKHLTDEHRAKLSISKMGDKNPNFGKRAPDETRKKLAQMFLRENVKIFHLKTY